MRFSAPARLIEAFDREFAPRVAPFILYGSGDFHHLSALWIRRCHSQPLTIVSFDNHPDWAITPPRWSCGSWINRALELPHVQNIHVWGCGNFECWWPGRLLGNRRAQRAGELSLHPWADNRPAQDRHPPGAILRSNWREHYQRFVRQIAGHNVYVTVDMDCLGPDEAITNWENGCFVADDLVWALAQLRGHVQILGGDICGAHSKPEYARWKQKFASQFDHPKLPPHSPEEIRRINDAALEQLWPALVA